MTTERTRNDIDPANTWVVSDTHFGHQNIVGYCHRPLDHEQVMIAEWRAAVPDDATVLHLGDLCYRANAQFKHILAPELTGKRKLLIQGNHDRQRYSFYRDCGFRVVKPFEIDYRTGRCERCVGTGSLESNDSTDDSWWACGACNGTGKTKWTISFSHYPLRAPNLDEHHAHLHGHIHNNGYGGKDTPFTPFSAGQINLSVEQTKYRPVNLKQLLDGYISGCYEPERPES